MAAVLVTGAQGFIGRHLVGALAADGMRVAGLGRGEAPSASGGNGLSVWISGDVTVDNLALAARQAGPFDVVYHLAGGSSVGRSLTHSFDDFANTVDATARLLDWLCSEMSGAALVVASSAAVYGSAAPGPIGEQAPLLPQSPYGVHKVMMEQLVASRAALCNLPSAIVRLFSVYGPQLRKQLLWDLCSRWEAGSSVMLGGTGAELRDWLHVHDAVRLLRLAAGAASKSAPVINGGTGRGTSVSTIAATARAAWGDDRLTGFSGVARSGDPPSLIANVGRAQALGFEPRIDVSAGVAEYVHWFRHSA